jgi:23S rRNA (guanosine2251-2'-O)-methyltransferase
MNKKNSDFSKSSFWIGGRHTVEAAINNPNRKIIKFVLHQKLINNKIIYNQKINIKYENDNFFNKIFKNEIPHQGYAALIEKIQHNTLKYYLEEKTISSIIALDGISDPRNIGSIIRTSVAFNFDAIIVNKKDFNAKSFLLYKSASGAIENIKILEVSNILNEIKNLKQNNFVIIGMDGNAQDSLYVSTIEKKKVIIFGSEGFGLKNLIRKNCDKLCKIPISNKINSLNVSNAVASTLAIIDFKK